MKKILLLLAIALIISGCGNNVLSEQTTMPKLEKTAWLAVSANAKTFSLDGGIDNPNFEYVFENTDIVPLDQLIAFILVADSLSEGAQDELRTRFLEAPNTVLAYLILMGDQKVDFGERLPASEVICEFIASADAAWYYGSEEFLQTVDSCKKNYPSGPAAHLLNVMELEHKACLEQNR